MGYKAKSMTRGVDYSYLCIPQFYYIVLLGFPVAPFHPQVWHLAKSLAMFRHLLWAVLVGPMIVGQGFAHLVPPLQRSPEHPPLSCPLCGRMWKVRGYSLAKSSPRSHSFGRGLFVFHPNTHTSISHPDNFKERKVPFSRNKSATSTRSGDKLSLRSMPCLARDWAQLSEIR